MKLSAVLAQAGEPIPRPVSRHLDTLRWIAAVGVVAGHIRGLLFVPFSRVSHPNIIARAFYGATAIGHAWVMVFFVLSGFLISRSVINALERGKWDPRDYLLQRLTRLWIVLIPALGLGAFLDILGAHLFGTKSLYHGLPGYAYLFNFDASRRLGLGTFLGNATFLQGIKVQTLGTNGPLWSLPYEFWYYLLFPLCLLLFYRHRTSRRILIGLALVVVGSFIGVHILTYFVVWLMGVGVLLLPTWTTTRTKKRFTLAVALAAWLGVFGIYSLTHNSQGNQVPADVGISLAFSLALYAIVKIRAKDDDGYESNSVRLSLVSVLAGFSYTLYLVHLPFAAFLKSAVVSPGPPTWQPNPFHLFLALLIAVLTMGYAFGVSRVTEAHTATVRSRLQARFLRPQAIAEPLEMVSSLSPDQAMKSRPSGPGTSDETA